MPSARPDQSLAQSPEHFRAVVAASGDAIIVKNCDGVVVSWNPAAERMFGWSAAEMIGQPLTAIFPPDRVDEEDEILARIAQGATVEHFQTVRQHRGGAAVHVSATIVPIRDPAGRVVGASKIARDLSERVNADRVIWRQANIDGLTQLPNRRHFMERLHTALGRSDALQAPCALILLSLDRFKDVNEALGHSYGDALLVQVADRIRAVLRPADLLARLDNHEFAVLLPMLGRGPALTASAGRIAGALQEPFRIDGQVLAGTASIGVAVGPSDGLTPEELLQHAEHAMREARLQGGNRLQHFTPTLALAAKRRQRLAGDLRHALELGEFELHYQPILHLAEGALRKCEALLRWRHPELGMIPPMEFIPLAEREPALIRALGDWAFRTAVAQAVAWRARFGRTIQIAVNLSPVQLRYAGEDLALWARLVRELRLPAGSIACEITEGMLVDPSHETSRRLRMLQEAGIELAVDDFGIGNSCFAYLSKLDLNTLKIDQSFIRGLATDPRNLAICEAIVVVAHALGLNVVAEGVETELQQRQMLRIGCDFVQGYLVCRPGPAALVETLFGPEAGPLAAGAPAAAQSS